MCTDFNGTIIKDGTFIKIDPNTGQGTFEGSFGAVDMNALVADDNGKLYAAGCNIRFADTSTNSTI